MKYGIVFFCSLSLVVLVTFIAFVVPVSSWAQSKQPTLKDIMKGPADEEKVTTEQPKVVIERPEVPQDELDRGVPLTSVKGFFKSRKRKRL